MTGEAREGAAPLVEAPPPRDVRRASDALRLTVALVTLALAVVLAVMTRDFTRTVQHGLLTAVTALPAGLRDLLAGVVQVAAAVGPMAALAVVVARRRWDAVLRVVPAAAFGVLLAWVLTRLTLAHGRPDQWPQVLAGRGALVQAGWPSGVYLAGCAAAVVSAGPWLGGRWRRALWALTASCAALSVAAAAITPLDALAALATGGLAGSAVLLLGGAPADRPPAQAVADALIACGVPVTHLVELPSADQVIGEGLLYRAELPGQTLTVRVLAREDRDRDLFRRLSRWLMLTESGDTAQSPLAAVEHELLMLVAAARAGARTVEPVIAYPVGMDAALLATAQDGAHELSKADMTDPVLTDLWRSVAHLQQRRVAHRALRPEHVLVGPDGHTRITAFARGQLAATTGRLGSDIAELLATTAVRVGPARATAAALAGLGPDLLATVLPYLQPLAIVGPARREVAAYDRATAARATGPHRTLRPGGRPSLLRDLAAEVQAATGAEPVPLAQLSRFTWKKALGLACAFLLLHLLLPQLTNAGAAVKALRTADWWWMLAALPTTFISQMFSAFLQAGTVPGRLPFGPNYLVQFAASFLNRITPNNVGGMALNLRFLQMAGVDSGAASASIGLQALANALSSALVAAVFFAWTGRSRAGLHLDAPAGHWLLPAVVIALAAAGLLAVTGPGRRFLHDRVWRFARSAGEALFVVAASPRKVALGVTGALGLPLIQVVGLALCVHALGGAIPFVQVGTVYVGARLIANAAPTPGGLGALEAGLIAGLTALGVAAGIATSAVLVYRLLTYWLNLALGGPALHIVERKGYV